MLCEGWLRWLRPRKREGRLRLLDPTQGRKRITQSRSIRDTLYRLFAQHARQQIRESGGQSRALLLNRNWFIEEDADKHGCDMIRDERRYSG